MCLGIPGRVVEWLDRDPIFARARIEFDGVSRDVHMACVPTAAVGDYVIVHAGIAICQIDEDEAQRVFDDWKRLATLEDQREAQDFLSGSRSAAEGTDR
jgi:hydrogenase expression/formation protein HypC